MSKREREREREKEREREREIKKLQMMESDVDFRSLNSREMNPAGSKNCSWPCY